MFNFSLNIKKMSHLLMSSMMTLVLMLSFTSPVVEADDTEVFISAGTTANVLFIFDLSSSMNNTPEICITDPITSSRDHCLPDTDAGEKSRYQILLDTLETVLDGLKTETNLRIGLSAFGIHKEVTGVLWPITHVYTDANEVDSAISSGTYQTHSMVLKLLSDYGTFSGTPMVPALYEAALYFRGDNITKGVAGNNLGPQTWDGTSFSGGSLLSPHPSTYSPAWDPVDMAYDASTTYKSPITSHCDNNYIVLLSDGGPNNNFIIDQAETLLGGAGSCSDSGGDNRKCGPELVAFMKNTDHRAADGIVPSNVKTHTIGFAIGGSGENYLRTLAEAGGGNFYSAGNADQLKTSLESVLTEIAGENESFSAFSTSTNASSLSSDDRIFINMFKPDDKRSWSGNTKGYFISSTGLLDINKNAAVETDKSSTNYGQFKETAQSFWSSAADGNDVEQGGVSAKLQLNASTRKIFTYTGSKTAATINNETLIDISSSDASLTANLFAAADDTEKNSLIDWLKNAPMGDPLHSNTIKIPYATKDVLFTITNQGLLHMVDVTHPSDKNDTVLTGGTELSAFIPQSLLPNLKDHKLNEAKADNHLYGLDGSLSYYHDDTDSNGLVDNGEDVFVYFGMRRGGKQYFALDVSNTAQPKLAWRIDGGHGDFNNLGQSWSRMSPVAVKWHDDTIKNVLVFGGGYDPAIDGHPERDLDSSNTSRSGDNFGNSVFMVEAETGDLLWSLHESGTASATRLTDANLKYSIPSDLTVIDSNSDTYADRIYFGDMGGQVWRIDFTSSMGSSGGSYAYRLADLAGNDATNFRRFYMPPGVAILRNSGQVYFAVAIGSGFRAHPLQTGVQDRFYMLKDTNVANASATPSWTLITDPSNSSTDLYNVTANVIGQGTSADAETNAAERETAKTALDNARGWRLDLEGTGEKALTAPLIFNHVLEFPTYLPTSTALTCGSTVGNSNLYRINLSDATPYKDYTGDSNETAEDRHFPVPGTGIQPKSTNYYAPPSQGGSGQDVTTFTGKIPDEGYDMSIKRINWRVIE